MLKKKKKLLATLAACCAGTVLQTTSCTQFYGEALLMSFDPCSILNCEGGTFFNLCEPYALLATCPSLDE